MKAPQIIWIVLMAIEIMLTANKHGKPKEGKESVWRAIFGAGIVTGLLIWGGFFS